MFPPHDVQFAQGLENEYDRLLSENDSLKRRLAQLDPASAASGSKKGM